MASIEAHTESRSKRATVAVACLLMVLACCAVDYLGGGEVRIGPWYVLPIALASWRLGRVSGLATAVLCALARVPVTILPFHADQLATVLTNSGLTLAAFLVAALLVARFRATHLNLKGTVAARMADLQATIAENEGTAASLRENERQLQAVFDTMLGGLHIADLETGRVLTANPAMGEMLGYTHEEVLALSVRDLHPAVEQDKLTRGLERLRRGEAYVVDDALCIRKDGTIIPVDLSVAPLEYRGRPCLLAFFRDATERQHATNVLRQSEANYRAIFNADDNALFVHDYETGEVVDFNQKAAEIYGFQPGDLAGLNEHFRGGTESPYSAEDRRRRVRLVVNEGPQTFEWLARTRDGRRIWMEMTLKLATIAGRGRILAAARDITERRRAERALHLVQERHRLLVETVADPIFTFDRDLRFVAVNPAAAQAMHCRPEDLVGRSVMDAFPPQVAERQAASVRRVFETGEPLFSEENESQTPGGPRWYNTSLTPMRGPDGRVELVIGIARDVTERRLAAVALKQSEENYRALFEQNQDGVVVLVDGIIASANQAAADVSGNTIQGILGKSAFDLVVPTDAATAEVQYDSAMQGGDPSNRFVGRVKRIDGTEAWVEARGSIVPWGGQMALQVIIHDITHQRRMEEELRQAQKLEALGQMAGGIAHDFNNLITGILCHAGLLKTGARADRNTLETATIIEKAARRAAELTSQLLGFARRGKHQDIPVDVGATLDTVVQLVRGTMDARIAIRKRLPPATVWVRGDPAQVEQAILNLAMNARDAMPDGGQMTLTVAAADLDATACASRPGAKPGSFIAVAVEDTGVGMSPAVRTHIFEPFFTTKPPGKGTGMGLPMVYGIVTNHGGWIEVESQPGHGSTFTVYLPASPGPVGRSTPALGRDPQPGAAVLLKELSARILLVDDDEAVRSAATRMLTGMGHTVVAVTNGTEALDYYRAFGARCDLVVIDMIMPGMDGRECLQTLRRLSPRLRAILCAGGGADVATRAVLEDGLVTFVAKPYTLERLADAVRAALGAPPEMK
jgi:two-component system, cell cycle sensor histidine kinase and response regulator CckA